MFDRIRNWFSGVSDYSAYLAASYGERYSKPSHPIWYKSLGEILSALSQRGSTSGVKVTPKIAETYSAAWACVSLIADTIGTLPRKLMLDASPKGDRKRTMEARLHPFWRAFCEKPNKLMSATTYHSMQLRFLINFGNCFAYMEEDSVGRTNGLIPIHPLRVPKEHVEVNEDGSLTYWVYPDPDRPGEKPVPRPIHSSRMLHICGLGSDDGIFGKGVFQVGAESLGIAIASDRYAAEYFGNGVHRGLYVSSKETLTQEQYRRMTDDWIRKGGLRNAHKPAILEGGATISSAYVPAEQTQLLESRKFNTDDVCRFYKVPPSLIGGGKVQAKDQDFEAFYTFAIMPWIVLYCSSHDDQCLGRKDTRKYFTKIDPVGLLMANLDRRSKYNREAWSIGLKTVNEIRIEDGMDPIGPDGDLRWVPSNTITIDHAKSLVDKTEAETEAAKKGAEAAGQGGPDGKPARPNDNTIDSPADGPSGDGTEKPVTKIAGPTPKLLEAAPGLSFPALEQIVLAEERRLLELAQNPGQFPDSVKSFYREDFTAGISQVLIRVSGSPLGTDTGTQLEELASSRLSSLEDLYDVRSQEFAGKLAFRLAADRPYRTEELRKVFAGRSLPA